MSMSSQDDVFDFLFKIVLIGDCGTGKTCITQRFKAGQFIEKHGSTIGVDFSMKTVDVDGKRVKVYENERIDEDVGNKSEYPFTSSKYGTQQDKNVSGP